MTNLPPDTIQVKRKRGTEHGPVDFLRLERSKRYRSDDGGWVYQRKLAGPDPSPVAAKPTAPAVPSIQPTRDGDEDRLLRHPGKPARAPTPGDATTSGAAPSVPAPGPPTTERLRRFHLSRPNSPQPAAGVSKKRAVPAVFVERGARRQRETLKAIIQEHNVTPAAAPKPRRDAPPVAPSPPANEKPAVDQPPSPPRQLKRPGTRAASASKPELPPSMRQREDTNMDELARAMDDWTLNEIAKHLGKMEEQSTASKYSPARSRFKPKAPAKRYFERHPQPLPARERAGTPQQAAAGPAGMDAADARLAESTDEEDYVLETYERVPAERLRDQAVPAHRVGLLVFDTEPDMVEFFYGNESDSEDDFPEDEDDENAENYYAADYPDEDLEWDDEFDRNPYHYTNQNDSDMEEFDEREFIDEILERYEQGAIAPG